MFKKLFLLISLVLAVGLTGCGNTQQAVETADDDGKIKVSVTFNAMEEFAKAIGGDKIVISAIVPDGASAHGFEPKANELGALARADVFIYNGLGMDQWAEEAAAAADNPGMIVVDTSEGADIIERDEHDDEHDDHDHDDEDHHGHSHGKVDPHLWLGLSGAKTQAENIKNALIKADPKNSAYYEENYTAFAAELDDLKAEYSEKFANVENRNFVTGHAAFGYLCRDFGLTQNSVRDIFAEGEPSAKQMSELVDYCKEHNVKTIFAEEMASPRVSETLANEVGAKVEKIYTIESRENGRTYMERMEENLSKIYLSLL